MKIAVTAQMSNYKEHKMSFSSDQLQFDEVNLRLRIPQRTMLVLCGASGSGKSSFAARNFPPTYVVSSDHYRGVVCDDERNLDSSDAAFDLVDRITEYRMSFGRPVVVDSTALTIERRQILLGLATRYNYAIVLLLFDTPQEVCRQRDAARINPPPVGAEVIAMQYEQYLEVRRNTFSESFSRVILLNPIQSPNLAIEINFSVSPI